MAFCSQCGYKNSSDARFCEECGQPLATESLRASPPEPISLETSASAPNTHAVSRKGLLAILVGLFILSALSAGTYVLLAKNGRPAAADSSQSPIDGIFGKIRGAISGFAIPTTGDVAGKWIEYTNSKFLDSKIEFFKDQTFVTSQQGVGGQWVRVDDGRIKLELSQGGTKTFAFAKVKGDLLEIETGDKAIERFVRSGSGEEKKVQESIAAQQDAIKAGKLNLEKKYDEAARLATSAAERGNAYGNYLLGVMYASGDGLPKDYSKAIEHFQKAADKDFLAAANGAAWYLATAPVESMRDGKKAMEYASKAMAKPSAAVVGTYAAALARTGDFAKAAETEAKALGMFVDEYRADKLAQPRLIYETAARRELFKSGKAFDLSMEKSPDFTSLVSRMTADGIGVLPGVPIEITDVKLFQWPPNTSDTPPLNNRNYVTTFTNAIGVEVHYKVTGPVKPGYVERLKISCEPQCRSIGDYFGEVSITAPNGPSSYIASGLAGSPYGSWRYPPGNSYKLVLNSTDDVRDKPIKIDSRRFMVP